MYRKKSISNGILHNYAMISIYNEFLYLRVLNRNKWYQKLIIETYLF